ncbi:aminotransferase class I/II-fold pyridoxal phosphate-dependent enzyme [Pseudomonas sp. Rh2]|uniref:aminotransferase class I/II-fold pyridoxal phosphate-dependent enzyme n=1 Tax=Pseudomonas sp. Rh2 TaxID=3112956 RepID=UPI00345C91B9
MVRSPRGEFAYQTVYHYLQALIADAQQSGERRLPSLRDLSRRLRVSLATVQSAYSLLEHEGRVVSVPKSGYFVQSDPQRGVQVSQGMTLGRPTVPAHPALERVLLAHERRLARQRERAASTWENTGDIRLRNALAERYTRSSQQYWCGEDVHLGSDVQGLLETVLEALSLRGATVVVASPCCWRLLQVLQRCDMQVLEVPLRDCGSLDVERLSCLLGRESVRMLVMPSCLGMPLGRLMPQHDQRRIAQLLDQHPVWLLENDLDSEHCFDAPPAARLRDWVDPCWLMVLGSLEASVGAEAPYAYVLCRNPLLCPAIAQRGFLLAPLRQLALAQLLAKGEVDANLALLQGQWRQRMELLCELVERHLGALVAFKMPEGGRTLWVRLHRSQPPGALSGPVLQVMPGQRYSASGQYRQHIALTWLADQPHALAEALQRLARVLESCAGWPEADRV